MRGEDENEAEAIREEYRRSGEGVPYEEWLEAKLVELVPECMKDWKEGP